MQHECIPQAVLSMDVLCQAKSGMGKTAVFVISTLQQIQESIDDVSVNQRVSCGLNQFSLSTNFCGFHQVVDQLNKCSLIAIFDNKWYASNMSIHKPDKEIHLITRNARAF